MREPEKNLAKEKRDKTILYIIDGAIVTLALGVYFGFSMIVAGFLSSSGFTSNYLVSVLVSFILIGPLAYFALRSYLKKEFEHFENLFYCELLRRRLIEFVPDANEDLT
jgi:hypothetical protein